MTNVCVYMCVYKYMCEKVSTTDKFSFVLSFPLQFCNWALLGEPTYTDRPPSRHLGKDMHSHTEACTWHPTSQQLFQPRKKHEGHRSFSARTKGRGRRNIVSKGSSFPDDLIPKICRAQISITGIWQRAPPGKEKGQEADFPESVPPSLTRGRAPVAIESHDDPYWLLPTLQKRQIRVTSLPV